MPNLNTINIGSSVSAQVSFTTAATGASMLKVGGTYGPGIAGSGSFSSNKPDHNPLKQFLMLFV